MAIALTDKGHFNASVNIGAFTPDNNSLICILIATADSFGAVWSMSGGGLTWTRRIFQQSTQDTASVAIFTAPVTTGASMTAVFSSTGSPDTGLIVAQVVCITGYDTVSPIGVSGSGEELGSDAINLSLSGSPSSTSVVIAGIMEFVNSFSITGITPGSGWTNLYTNTYGFGGTGYQYNIGTTSSSVPWQDACVGDTEYCQVVVGLEIKAAGGGGGSAYVAGQSALSFMGMA